MLFWLHTVEIHLCSILHRHFLANNKNKSIIRFKEFNFLTFTLILSQKNVIVDFALKCY